jgi:tetratricopeptide (TPR) repeat protein
LRGQAYYQLGEHEQAVAHYREGLKLDPEHADCKAGHKLIKAIEKKVKKGDEAFEKQEFQAAVENYHAALALDERHYAFNRPLSLKLAQAYSRLGNHKNAIAICQKHVTEEETVEGLWALGQAQLDAELFEEAVRSYQRAAEVAPEGMKQQANQKVQEARVALKQSKEKNYYKILGISRTASPKDIKSAYR